MKILFVSLGCDKNLVDSEKMIGSLKAFGHEITNLDEEAEAAVINTCAFIHDAQQESVEQILTVAELKKSAKLKYLIVMGCLAERYRNTICEEIPEVDAVIGTGSLGELPQMLSNLESGKCEDRVINGDVNNNPVFSGRRTLSSINHYSYIKIAEGCDKHCTYCVIPAVKGKYRSYDFDAVISEAEELAKEGINELTVIAQETTLYGTDLYGKKRLPELLHRLCRIEGIEWIRLMYCYPEEITDELIEVFASEEKMCHYIDMPIQHAADTVLKRMGRKTDSAQIKDIIKKLRKRIPDMVIRTSLITGFPGETEEEHKILLDFIKEYKLERVGVFTYSKEKDTPAYKMKNHITQKVKNQRRKELMLEQQKCVFEHNRKLVGRKLKVIVDGKLPEDGVYVGRTYMDAPGIDGNVFVESERDIISGSIIETMITGFDGYDLTAEEFIKD